MSSTSFDNPNPEEMGRGLSSLGIPSIIFEATSTHFLPRQATSILRSMAFSTGIVFTVSLRNLVHLFVSLLLLFGGNLLVSAITSKNLIIDSDLFSDVE